MNKYSCKFCWEKSSLEEIRDHIKEVINSNIQWKGTCLEWVGYKDKDGYGRMKYFKKFVHSTRCVWFFNKGEFPTGKVICHSCDNPSCVLIDHLFIGTVKDNTIDAFQKGRRKAIKGHKSNWAKLSEDQVKEIKKMLQLKVPQSKIGLKFNISRSAICDISRGRNWKHVKDTE